MQPTRNAFYEIQRIYSQKGQPYLSVMYKALFAISYYGLLRVGEVTCSDHVIKAKDVYAALTKDKLLLVLYSSKTHSKGMRPQKIRITSNFTEKSGFYAKRNFCPFKLVHDYMHLRGGFLDNEQFFVFKDKSPVYPVHARKVLKTTLMNLGLDANMYGMHSFRVGRTSDLIKYNYSLEEVKRMG